MGDRQVVTVPAVARQFEAVGRRGRLVTVDPGSDRAGTEVLADRVRGQALRVSGVEDDEWSSVRTSPGDGGEVIDVRRSVGDVSGVKALSWAVHRVEVSRHSGPVLVA